MNNPKVSIIVPVYNGYEHLDVCIKSLLNQSLKDVEIILIDDKSIDGSYEILKKYTKYQNVYVYQNDKNMGAGATRNRGIELAKGEYIGFVDCDDYVSQDMYELAYECAKKNDADIVMEDLVFVRDDEFFRREKVQESCELVNIRNKKDSIAFISISPCNKIYKSSLIKNIRFPEGCKWEDIGFTSVVFFSANSIYYICNHGYFYRKNINKGISYINYCENDSVSDIINVVDYIKEEFKKNGLFQEYYDSYEFIIAFAILQRVFEITNWIDSEKKTVMIKYLYSELYKRVGDLSRIDICLLSAKVKFDIIDDYLYYAQGRNDLMKIRR